MCWGRDVRQIRTRAWIIYTNNLCIEASLCVVSLFIRYLSPKIDIFVVVFLGSSVGCVLLSYCTPVVGMLANSARLSNNANFRGHPMDTKKNVYNLCSHTHVLPPGARTSIEMDSLWLAPPTKKPGKQRPPPDQPIRRCVCVCVQSDYMEWASRPATGRPHTHTHTTKTRCVVQPGETTGTKRGNVNALIRAYKRT